MWPDGEAIWSDPSFQQAAPPVPAMTAPVAPTTTEVEDTQGLNAAVQAEMQRMRQAQASRAQDPQFGSLMRDFSKADFEVDPGYGFVQSEGEKGMQRAASAGGLLGSGKFLKDAMRFNQGLASQEYGKSFDRFQVNRSNKLNPMQSLAGVGQTSANTMGAAGQNFANSGASILGNYGSALGQNIMGAGNAQAAGRVGSANAWNSAIGQGMGMYQQQNMLNRFFPQGGGGGGFTGGPPNPFMTDYNPMW